MHTKLALIDMRPSGNLFTETSSIATKYVGLLAFKACLNTVEADLLPALFTPNVLRTLMNHLSKGDRTLHGVAVQIVRDTSIAIPKCLISSN